MEVQEILSQARDAMTVKRVFGDPIEKNGVTVLPVARVGGGGGGGSGPQPMPGGAGGQGEDQAQPQRQGTGAGFGMRASPAGVYVIRGDQVTWQPAIDVNRVILGGQIVAIVLLLTIRAIVKYARR